MENEFIINILEEQEYPSFMYEKTVTKIQSFDHRLKTMFLEWVETKKEPQFIIEGYSYEKLTREFKMNPIGAFVTLDWLIKEPEAALRSLNRGIK